MRWSDSPKFIIFCQTADCDGKQWGYHKLLSESRALFHVGEGIPVQNFYRATEQFEGNNSWLRKLQEGRVYLHVWYSMTCRNVYMWAALPRAAINSLSAIHSGVGSISNFVMLLLQPFFCLLGRSADNTLSSLVTYFLPYYQHNFSLSFYCLPMIFLPTPEMLD